jgi:NADP-dependent 3-hydroxy acid dehydrogenase YdfG
VITILVTGASSGIGHAVALALADAGHNVIAAARRRDHLDALTAKRRSMTPLTLDVTSDASVAAAMEQLNGRRIDVLVNNAGYAEVGPIEDVPAERITAQFETNVTGAVRMIQAVLPGMRKRRVGRIVNVSSVAGRVALPFMGIYSASKFALEGLSDAL